MRILFASIFLIFAAISASASASASVVLTPEAILTWPASMKFEKTKVGGLSGLTYADGSVILVSDDRGKINDPRFYEGELKLSDKKLEVKLKSVHFLRDMPGLKDHSVVVDPEDLVKLPDGSLLIATEADTDRKPREKNRLMRFTPQGAFLSEIAVPEDLQAEALGQQTKGTGNNFGFEGLSLSPSGKVLWASLERPLVQEKHRQKVRFERFKLDEKGNWKHDKTFAYLIEVAQEGSREIVRGVSAILALDDERLLVIERSGVFLPSKILGFGGGIFQADCQKEMCAKSAVMNFEKDLSKIREGQPVANFEGLAWGPLQADGTKTVLLLSDNNFKSSDATELLVLSFKEKTP